MIVDKCDIEDCNKKATGMYEDMTDGEWVSLCSDHAIEFEGYIR